MNGISRKLLSLFLALTLVLQLIPVQALGLEPIDLTESDDIIEESTDSQSSSAANDAEIVAEIPEGRGEFQKEFLLDNGMQMIAMYGKPVHYEEDGEWKEIDNTLQLSTGKISLDGSTSGSVYHNTAGIWDVSLPATLNNNAPVTVSRDGYSLSFRLTGEIHNNHSIMGVVDETEQTATIPEEPETTVSTEPVSEVTAVTDEVSSDTMTPTLGEDAEASEILEEEEFSAESEVSSETNNLLSEIAVPIEEENTVEEETPSDDEESLPVEDADAPVDTTVPENSNSTPGLNDADTGSAGLSAPISTPVEMAETIALVQPSTAKIAAVEAPVDHIGQIREETILSKLNTALEYQNIYTNTDLRYDLISHALKESVIIKSTSETLAGYSYALSTTGLVLELQDDNSILAYASDAEEGDAPVFTMPAPYLVDAEHNYCGDVSVILTGDNGSYTLTYQLPRQWMTAEERVYPVTLDPVVETESHTLTIEDQSVFQYNQFGHLWEYLELGYDPGYGKERIFIKFTNLPELSSADVIVGANLFLRKVASTSAVTMEAHEVLGTWKSSTINWSNKPSYNSLVEDFQRVGAAGWYSWSITDIVQKWYSTGKNNGVMFCLSSSVENGTTSNYHQFYSSDAYSNLPALYITYLNNCGLENYWDYTSQSAGRAGTGHINNFTGNLVWVHEGLSFSGNRMPVSISSVYNANDDGDNTYGFGYGWRTNYSQYVYKWDKDSSYYVWIDQDGTRQYFKYKSSNTYENELDSKLVLKTGLTGNYKYSITDKDGNISYFNSGGHLVRLQNKQKTVSYIDITRKSTAKLIDTITDGAGRLYKFEYNSNNLVSAIKYYGTDTTMSGNPISTLTYSYDSQKNLTSIGYPDGKSVTFSYAGTHLLSGATDIDGYAVSYTYNTTDSTKPNRVTKVTEKDGSVVGGVLDIEYAHNQTTFTDHNGNTEIVQFNNYGSTISIQDDQGHAQFAQYAGNNARKSASQMTLSSKLQNTVVDLLRDGSFEESTNYWTAAPNNGTDGSWSKVTDPYLEKKSLKISRTTANTSYTVIPTSNSYATALAGEYYTLSAYVKTSGATASISLAHLVDGALQPVTETVECTSAGWQRIEVTYQHTGSSSATLVPCLTSSGGTGSVWFDCVQLEQSATASRYNIIENGDFRYSTSVTTDAFDWLEGSDCRTSEKRTTYTGTPAAPHMDNSVYAMSGSSVLEKRSYQDIQIAGSKGDVYSFGGWAKGNSVPLSDSTRRFGMILRFYYTDGTEKEHIISFNPDCDSSSNWQYAAGRAVAEKAYSYIRILLVYETNRNTIYYDGIQLFKEEFGQSYAYDSNGNVVSTTDLQGQKTTYEYTSNNLTKATLPSGVIEEYTYDDWNNVKTATSSTGVTSSFTYDDYGNNTAVTISADGKTLTSTAAYTADGNQLASVTDPLGKTTTYSYNTDTGVLDWVQAPGETETTRTNYTYDNLYRTTDVSKVGSDVTYTYTNDLLESITSASGTVYNFTYGDFDLVQSVGIGTRTLISHEYSADANRYLEKSTYGNGDTISYTYDELGRAESKTYEDGDTVTYTYDNNGNLGQVTDSGSGRTTRYYYDLQERLSRYSETGNGFSSDVTWEYNADNNLAKQTHVLNGDTYTTNYTYDDDNQLTGTAQGNIVGEFTYDKFGRMTGVVSNNGETSVVSTTISFTDPTDTTTSSQVATWTNSVGGSYSYTYDDRGNILTISDGNSLVAEYTYDSLDQLTVEKNHAADKRWEYAYDAGGNILSKTEYASVTATSGTTVSYDYTDAAWRDLLTVYDGETLDYDALGNLERGDGIEYYWVHGRQLDSLQTEHNRVHFTYNADGMRIGKLVEHASGVEDTIYQYHYVGDTLAGMTRGSDELYFVYDVLGPSAVIYNGTTYYYTRNAQGDITGIVNASGTQVVSYTYDAWGNPLTTTGTMASTLGSLNPLRYRGYVYDSETGLYYLQSRYYNPNWGRFICSDQHPSTGQGLSASNMFAYCGNNPVCRKDEDGEAFETVFDVISLGFSIAEVAANPYDVGAWMSLIGDTIDLVPIVTGVGEAVRGVRLADKAGNVVEIAKAVDFTDDAKKTMKSLDQTGVFTKSEKLKGVQIHNGYKKGTGFNSTFKEYTKKKGIRPDYYDGETIFELKPFNPRAAKAGVRQLRKYNTMLGGGNVMRLEMY